MKIPLFIAVLGMSVSLFAADFRIDCSGKKGLNMDVVESSEGVKAEQAAWMKEKKAQRLVVIAKVTKEWKDYSFTFKPQADGYVEFQLMSTSAKTFFACDNIRVEGAKIKNGSFETKRPDGKIENLWTMKNPRIKSGNAADGKIYVETAHNDRYLQTIACKKDVPVTVTLAVRSITE